MGKKYKGLKEFISIQTYYSLVFFFIISSNILNSLHISVVRGFGHWKDILGQ